MKTSIFSIRISDKKRPVWLIPFLAALGGKLLSNDEVTEHNGKLNPIGIYTFRVNESIDLEKLQDLICDITLLEGFLICSKVVILMIYR